MQYNTNIYYLGKLCPVKHQYLDTGQTLRRKRDHDCVKCQDRRIHKCRGRIEVTCENCSGLSRQTKGDYKRSKHHFCSHSCSASWRNKNKTTGFRRSKLEKYIEQTLKKNYPDLQILFNDRKEVGLELDIYFPDLKLAVELNGIVHYEPIYGLDKFNLIHNNDKIKSVRCFEKGIELVVIDVTAKGKRRYYNIIDRFVKKNFPLRGSNTASSD